MIVLFPMKNRNESLSTKTKYVSIDQKSGKTSCFTITAVYLTLENFCIIQKIAQTASNFAFIETYSPKLQVLEAEKLVCRYQKPYLPRRKIEELHKNTVHKDLSLRPSIRVPCFLRSPVHLRQKPWLVLVTVRSDG